MPGVSTLIGVFMALCGGGVLAVLLLPESRSPRILAWFGALASCVALWAGGAALYTGGGAVIRLWTLPEGGALTLRMDGLSALFVCVIALVFLPTSIFLSGYLPRYAGRYSLKAFGVMYLALFASIVLILMAADLLSFLMAWETMSILSYLLVNYDYEPEGHARAGYVMLAISEAGTLAAMAAFLLLAPAAGSLDFSALKAAAPEVGTGLRWAVFLLSFFGFGVKAGLTPVNFWLPRAYTVAPSVFVPVLAGATLNLGIYGIVRVNVDLLPMTLAGPGLLALIVGTVTALVGILYATTENDLKTMLAHSSIENAGIIAAGLGAGFVFTATGHAVPAGIAFIAALYHLTNHALYKTLLFLGAGAVDDRAGTRDLDRLGGLIHRMPWTALLFLAGAISIAALPPWNGFVSEWLTLQTLLRSAELSSTTVKIVFVLCGAGLALTAALAITCFVKAFAMGFLGMPRSRQADEAREAPRSTVASMGLLATLCLFLGVLPTYMIPVLNHTVRPMTGADVMDALTPPFFATHPDHDRLPRAFATEFHDLGAQVGQEALPGRGLVVMHRGGDRNPVVFAMSTSYTLVVLLGLMGLTYGAVRLGVSRKRTRVRRARWDGGVRRLLPEMTYTATGFSHPVRVIFEAVFRPATMEDTREAAAKHFRTAIHRTREEVYIADRLIVRPLAAAALYLARGLAVLHQGKINAYVAYGLSALLVVLALALWS